MNSKKIVEAAKKVDKALIAALEDVDWVDLDARASIITTAIAMYLRRKEPNLKTVDFFAAACISVDPIGALERITEYLDPGRRLRDMARAGSAVPPKTDGECEHKPEPYSDGEFARCNACGDGSFPVTYEASQGLEKGVVKWMADEETGVELLRLLTAYQRGADRGELKAFLDVRRPI